MHGVKSFKTNICLVIRRDLVQMEIVVFVMSGLCSSVLKLPENETTVPKHVAV